MTSAAAGLIILLSLMMMILVPAHPKRQRERMKSAAAGLMMMGLVSAHPNLQRERITSTAANLAQSDDDGSCPGPPEASEGEDDKRGSKSCLV